MSVYEPTTELGEPSDVPPNPAIPPMHEIVRLGLRTTIVAGIAFAFLALFLLVWYAADILMIAFAGALFSVVLRSLANVAQRMTKLSYNLSLIAVLCLSALVAVLLALYLVPTVADQASRLSEELPKAVTTIRDKINQSPTGRWALERLPDPAKLVPPADAMLARTGSVLTAVLGAFGAFGIAFMTFVIGLLLAFQPQLYYDGFMKIVPPVKRLRAAEVIEEVDQTLKWWLVSKLVSMVAIGCLTYVGLYFLDIKLALTLAVITGVLAFIPNFGPFLSTIPPMILALEHGPGTALWVLALYIGVQFIESNFITPYVEYRTVSLPPALTVVTQLAAGALLGGLGLTLASPLLAMLIVLVQMLYVEDVLGDYDIQKPTEHGSENV